MSLEGRTMMASRSLAVTILLMAVATGCSAPIAGGASATVDSTLTPGPTVTLTPTLSPIPILTSAPMPTAAPTPTPEPTLTPTIAGIATNDDPPGTAITSLPFVDSVNVTRAQIHAMEAASACGSGSQSVWYSFVATTTGTVIADTHGSDYDTILDVYRGILSADGQSPGFENLDPLACNDNSEGSAQAGVAFQAVAGQAYLIRITTALNDPGGNLHLSLTAG
jgi:hypothetical protein